jgi:hypothetical protein
MDWLISIMPRSLRRRVYERELMRMWLESIK